MTVCCSAALLGLACAGCAEADTQAPTRIERGVVASILDGDTLRLRDGRRVRLVQLDAPERGECFGERAARALARLVPPGAMVELEADARLDDRDEHGRLLRYVRAGGRDVTLALVESGAAAPYFFRGERGRRAAELLLAARAARDARRGLWGSCPRARLAPSSGAVTR